ncbi:hypothetical protein TRAPUB_12212 [Trametes pubescens]|uniref:Uncharacterized protein n=1 Tax=Trametes pubescens TaxID=154538 RepID=A0A1M2VUG9_TRAPU|nr:hypothetical protein TRAPUB_12212 [Trametes pubescens]
MTWGVSRSSRQTVARRNRSFTRSDQDKPAPNVINAYRRAPAATIWPREAEATTVRPARVSNSSLKQIGFPMINSTNTAHLGCGSRVTSALASPFVLVPLALALMAVVAAVGTCRRRRAARVYLDHPVMAAESTIEVEKGWMAVA